MNHLRIVALALAFCLVGFVQGRCATLSEEIATTAASVSGLRLGFQDYILGERLTPEQKRLASEHPVDKALEGTYKFQDGELFVVADTQEDRVLGMYRENKAASPEQVKAMIGELMLRFAEPTTMAHGKLIYWSYDQNGKIAEEYFEQNKASGEIKSLATVKFSSSQPLFMHEKEEKKAKAPEPASIYVLISSDPLSSLYLSKNKGNKQP